MPLAHSPSRIGETLHYNHVMLSAALLDVLACPSDKGPLLYFPDEPCLYNPRLRMRYEISNDIPIMLIDKATTLDDREHERLTALAAELGIEPTFTE